MRQPQTAHEPQDKPPSARLPALLALLCLLGMGAVVVLWFPHYLPDIFQPARSSSESSERPMPARSWRPLAPLDDRRSLPPASSPKQATKAPARLRSAASQTQQDDPKGYPLIAPDHPKPDLEYNIDHGTKKSAGLPGARARWVPPGTFVMGSSSSAPGREPHEGPTREIRITKGFWIWRTEVTQYQYKLIMGVNPSRFQGCRMCPVENVSWFDAEDFAAKLSRSSSRQDCRGVPHLQCKGWRLPTEAEWAYAAIIGATLQGPADAAQSLDAIAWHAGNSGMRTHPVATKQPNALGLYDMLGNVYEWCRDRYDSYPKGDATDPAGPLAGADRIFRGGSWFDGPRWLRIAHRNHWRPHYRDDNVGFRLVMTGR